MNSAELTIRVHMPGARSLLVRVVSIPNPGWTMLIDKRKYVVTEVCQSPSFGMQCHSLDVYLKPHFPSED